MDSNEGQSATALEQKVAVESQMSWFPTCLLHLPLDGKLFERQYSVLVCVA